jgi:hypothetical protein
LTSEVETPTAPRPAATAPVAAEPAATPSRLPPVSPPDADGGSDPDPPTVDDDFSFDPDEAARPTRGRPPAKRASGFGTNEMEYWKDD